MNRFKVVRRMSSAKGEVTVTVLGMQVYTMYIGTTYRHHTIGTIL